VRTGDTPTDATKRNVYKTKQNTYAYDFEWNAEEGARQVYHE